MIGEHPSGKDNGAITAMRLLAQASTNASNFIADFCFKLEEDMRELEGYRKRELSGGEGVFSSALPVDSNLPHFRQISRLVYRFMYLF